ncbi:helix-turn-helix transcriptional regulator [Paenibacillus sp. FSL P4-0176]|uniref:helix-turn-helix domain-containing protein n=1 Tax=Paenibacillus sp. FSL P4-0176 TaxID=2921631 RepID=UPI0030CD0F1F
MGKAIEENMQRLIGAKGWTVYRLSKESGVAVSALYSIGKKRQGPYVETLIKLSNALGCTVDDLVKEQT